MSTVYHTADNAAHVERYVPELDSHTLATIGYLDAAILRDNPK